ncbi:MAG: DUF1707 SHOCT-like domain-containing protein [Solirubrobacteraceae bacterium]
MSRHGTLRASDADRDHFVDRLHKAATEGRIGSDELEQRVSSALKARTYNELEATVADLPRPKARGGQIQRQRSTGSWALSTVRANPALLLFAIPVIAVTAAMVLAVTIVWSVLMIVLMILGGRRHGPPSPWAYMGRQALRTYGRRGPGRHWA